MPLLLSTFWTDPATGGFHEFTDWDDGQRLRVETYDASTLTPPPTAPAAV